MNSSQRPQEAPQATPRWLEVLAPSYRIEAPSRPSQPVWIQRMNEGKLPDKDLTNGIR
jgi:hypothetical protein